MQGKYSFLKIVKVSLRNFSLYSKNGVLFPIEEEINDGVYCLAGANGLGKSTFLNAINYGLTGIVLDPEKKEAYLPEEIVKFNKSYTERYFEGRIKAKEKDKAEIELLLKINGKFVRIIRSFSNREELRLLEFYENKSQKKHSILKTVNLSPKELQNEYESIIEKEIGIGKFNYFIFFQLYVMSFDETRRMLFWDENASTSALSIAFNENIQDTEKVLELKKKMEEFESYGRNARWQATQVKNEIDKLIDTSKTKGDSEYRMLEKEYLQLIADIEESEKVYNEINIEYDTLLKRQNLINSDILQLKITYRKLFSQYSEPRSNLIHNPLIQIAKRDNKCFLCNAEGHNIVESIERKLFSQTSCPACDTPINNGDEKVQSKLMSQIKKIDKELEEKNKELEDLMLESEAKKIDLDRKYVELNRLKSKFNKFEKENKGLTFGKTGDAPLDSLIDEYKKQYSKLDKNSIDYYTKRDKILPEYKNLQKKVEKGFKETQDSFVPLFKQFAFSFIGLDLNLYAKPKGKSMVFNFVM